MQPLQETIEKEIKLIHEKINAGNYNTAEFITDKGIEAQLKINAHIIGYLFGKGIEVPEDINKLLNGDIRHALRDLAVATYFAGRLEPKETEQ